MVIPQIILNATDLKERKDVIALTILVVHQVLEAAETTMTTTTTILPTEEVGEADITAAAVVHSVVISKNIFAILSDFDVFQIVIFPADAEAPVKNLFK